MDCGPTEDLLDLPDSLAGQRAAVGRDDEAELRGVRLGGGVAADPAGGVALAEELGQVDRGGRDLRRRGGARVEGDEVEATDVGRAEGAETGHIDGVGGGQRR